MAGHSPPAG